MTQSKIQNPKSKIMLLRRLGFTLLFALLACGGAILSAATLGRTSYRWHGLVVELRLMPAAQGATTLALTPLGEVRARTHHAPVALIASLEEIQIEEIRKALDKSPNAQLLSQDFERTAKADLRDFVLRQIFFAALGGLAAPILLRNHRMRYYIGGPLFGVLLIGATLGSALTTFDGKAFDAPVYSGALKEAPWIIRFGTDAFTKIDALSSKLQIVAGNLNVLYGRISAVTDPVNQMPDADAIRVLHISDIHNNPAAFGFVRKVAEQFHADIIVDTGDLTDFGSPLEDVFGQQIAKLPYPYIYVAGNHDSLTTVAALANLKNVTVLNGQIAEIKGLRFLGLPNPASARAGVGSVDTTPQELQINAAQLLQDYHSAPDKPDIIAVHDPKQGVSLWGIAPLILCGHLHTPSLTRQTAPFPTLPNPFSTIICNAGTTGAAGLRYFEGPDKTAPFTCAVLTFSRLPAPASAAPAAAIAPLKPDAAKTPPAAVEPLARPRLRAVDIIVLDGKFEQYSISHTAY